MKIIEYHGGLGNQLFEYVYYKYLVKKYPQDSFYSYFPKRSMKAHYGLEINKWFEVEIAPCNCWVNFIGFFTYWGIRIFRRIGVHLPWVSDDTHLSDEKLFHEGWYQNKFYFLSSDKINFRGDLELTSQNIELIKEMTSVNSVSVHIRRGDYLLKKNAEALGGICTLDYYKEAILLMTRKIVEPTFFFFSDDPEFVKCNFNLPNMVVVSNNIGDQSFFDMYLMTKAKNMILANSTFSCWAAYLNKNHGIIIAPQKWNRKIDIDLNLSEWITL